MLKHLDLFSGIGGFALAARMVGGYETVGFCEIEPYCQAVLRRHWPGVPVHDDVRSFPGIAADIITAGFPCQDISNGAGSRAQGLGGERSGLWFDAARIIRSVRPDWVVLENSPRLRFLGADEILSELELQGYTARPFVVGAIHAGARHRRQRTWIIANANRLGIWEQPGRRAGSCGEDSIQLKASWNIEPGGVGAVDGLRAGMVRRRHIGNAIVPQVAAIFLQAIKECEGLTP